MFQSERQEKILHYINEKRRVHNAELCEEFKTSVVTIRNDLNELAKQKLLVKTFGGAIALEERLNMEIPNQTKYKKNIEAKRKIAKIAVSLIEENDVIILDSGSTTLEIARNFGNKSATVITNDLQIGLILAAHRNVKVYMTGGGITYPVFTLMGEQAIKFIEQIQVNKVFLGVDAIDFENCVTNRTLEEVSVKQAMMKASKKVIACADSSKFGQKVFAKLCEINELDMLVTEKIDKKSYIAVTEMGVKVVTSEKQEEEEIAK